MALRCLPELWISSVQVSSLNSGSMALKVSSLNSGSMAWRCLSELWISGVQVSSVDTRFQMFRCLHTTLDFKCSGVFTVLLICNAELFASLYFKTSFVNTGSQALGYVLWTLHCSGSFLDLRVSSIGTRHLTPCEWYWDDFTEHWYSSTDVSLIALRHIVFRCLFPDSRSQVLYTVIGL